MDYIETIKQYVMEKNNHGKYSIFNSSAAKPYLDSKNKDVIEIILENDMDCNLPIDLGVFLDNISTDSRNVVAFSRVYIGELDKEGSVRSDEIVDIATNGLKNNGHINSSGVYQKVNSPSDCLSPLTKLSGWINLVGSYKKNNATILYSFPSEFMSDDCHFENHDPNNVYDFKDNLTYLKPEYLIGMIIKNKEGLDIFLDRNQMLEMGTKKTR